MKENRRLWKLILFTIPTFGIYNLYFWFRFTQDLNEMNPEEKKIKNYILVCFLSLITLGIYRWVWLFYLQDRLQITGEKYNLKLHPGPGTTLFLWTFGKFILIGPLLADFFIIRNINILSKAYNHHLSKNTKVISDDVTTPTTTSSSVKEPIRSERAVSSQSPLVNTKETVTNTVSKPVVNKTLPNSNTNPTTVSGKSSLTSPMNRTMPLSESKPKVVNKQVITPEKNTHTTTAQKETAATKENTSSVSK